MGLPALGQGGADWNRHRTKKNSLIVLLYIAHGLKAQAAMDDANVILKDAVVRFVIAANALLDDNAGHKLVKADLAQLIDSCRYACTANLDSRWVVTRQRLPDLYTNLGEYRPLMISQTFVSST